MNSRIVNIVTGFIGAALVAVFVVGLAHSIAIGFAGFYGALPFLVIVALVLSLVIYDFYDQCIRDHRK
ncbi:MAG: hypothetical protein ACI9UN_000914 [Granulosicoccus sp.]|jgi:hypothetical protein